MSLKPPISPTSGAASVLDSLDARIDDLEAGSAGEVVSATDPTYGAAGDGVADDTAELQAAATAATSGTLLIPPGTYLVSAAIVLPNKIRVQGAGMETTIIKVKDGTTMNGHVFQGANRTGCEVSDLQVDLNKAGTTDPGADTAGAGVGFSSTNATGTTHCAVRRVKVINGHRVGIVSTSSSTSNPNEVTVEGCKVTGCVKRGIYITRPTAVVIRGNYLSGNNTSDSGGGQIQATTGGVNVLIEGNTCIDGTVHGIAVAFIDGVRIIGNYCRDNDAAGASGWGIVVSEDVTNFEVVGNRCLENGAGNISIDVKTAASETIKESYGTVSGNVCSNAFTNHGIYIQYARYLSVTGNVCHDNPAKGIFLVAAKNCTVTGNVCEGNDKGIASGDSATATAGGPNLIVGNHCLANTTLEYEDLATNKSTWSQNTSDDTFDVASAATVTLPVTGEYFNITGTADITSVTASWVGRRVTLKFAGTAAASGIVDGSNLKLASTLGYTPDDTITLVTDGTNWHEVGRGVN